MRNQPAHGGINECVFAQRKEQREDCRRSQQPHAPVAHDPDGQQRQPQRADAKVIRRSPVLAVLEKDAFVSRCVPKAIGTRKFTQPQPGMDQRKSA